jgi:hypothetical protein
VAGAGDGRGEIARRKEIAMADGSSDVAAPRDAGGRFAAGNAGRRLGSRNRVSKRVALALLGDFETHQAELLVRLRRWFLPQYLQLIIRLLPRPSADDGLELETLEPDEALALVAAVRAAADRYEAGEGSIEDLEAALLGAGIGDADKDGEP